MRTCKNMLVILITLLALVAGIQSRILTDYANIDQSLTKAENEETKISFTDASGDSFPAENYIRLYTISAIHLEEYLTTSSRSVLKETVCKWLVINLGNWATEILCNKQDDLGRKPRPAPPSPRPPPGSRPL